jgi:hypothetical protein
MGNQIFIFSTSLDSVNLDVMQSRFGPYIVRIDSPIDLARDINEALTRRQERFGGGVEGHCVRYDQGEVSGEDFDHWDFVELSYRQKPQCFRNEKEFRFVVINTNEHVCRVDGDHLIIDIGKPIDYAVSILGPDSS